MDYILTSSESNEQVMILLCLCFAVFRIYLEVVDFRFDKLPMTKALMKNKAAGFHRAGFYLSVGYLVLFGPQFFLS